jgi:hypothetical protein
VILRQEREWRIVKNEVCFMIRLELAMLLDEILELTDNGLDFKATMLSESDKQKKKKLLIEKLEELKKEVTLNSYTVSLLLKNKGSMDGFIDISKRLSTVELKYSRQLPAEVVFSLLRLQFGVESLEQLRKLYDSIKELNKKEQTPIITEFLPLITEELEKNILGFIKVPIKEMLVNIDRLYSIGFEFSYPIPTEG